MNREHDNHAKQEFSDEFLNAFLDNQLTLEEKDRAYLRISQDEALNRRVCELRKIQDMVRLSYQNPPPPSARPVPTGRHGRLGLSLAAGIALVTGVALGWVLHNPAPLSTAAPAAAPVVVVQPAPTNRIVAKAAMVPAPAAVPAPPTDETALTVAEENNILAVPYRPGPASGDVIKVLIHVNNAVAARTPEALDEIENLVRHYRDQRQNARVEVVMNGEGLNLIRVDTTRFAERIRRMQEEYDNLTFAACQNTIQRLKREHGITAKLLPGVTVIDSGVAQIMRRQQQGWAYIQV
ncbi:MAG: DsrE family protein [Gammaproteobacteria bacterium]|nr:DsrE family protein [Gammaproteobacteria bacterium]